MLFKCSPSVFYHNVFTSGSIFPLTILPLPKSIGQRKSSVSASDLLLLWPNIPCFFTLKIEQLNQWRIPQSFSSRPIPCFFTLKIEHLNQWRIPQSFSSRPIPCFFTLKIEQLNQWRIPQSFSSRPIPCFFTLKIEQLDSEESHSPSLADLYHVSSP